MNVVVNGLMINYQKTGNGKALVFLPGWGDSTQTYLELAARLKQDYEIYLLDLPGFGNSQPPAVAWNLDDYAEFLGAWLKKMDLKPQAIVGHSYGGAVAITAASKGDIANHLVLLASAGIRNKNKARGIH
jgi:pimeloyl-ACP methyl ester carboxylesterase